jgi:UDP-N-acetylglucosamine--N-acetylmuramyl-(pentapeptide) pyrophosphoryl-undecaprenol N-acetylglucosamine transferase
MKPEDLPVARVAIACGGTGGHLFPGLAVAEELKQHGCAVTLLISPKEVDQQAVKSATGLKIATLPAVGLSEGKRLAFARGFLRSFRCSRELFRTEPPEAVLAMGGFTSAAPLIAGRMLGTPVFLHESNTIPGRANRWLSRLVNQAFLGFGEAAPRLHARSTKITGTPCRPQFKPGNPAHCRVELGLAPDRPVLLVTGGSQGATGLNNLVIEALPILARRLRTLQLFHLAGANDTARVEAAARAAGLTAVVHAFFSDMHLALGAADVAASRAGASSLAELAAMRLPAVLVPYPAATDDHQFFNAQAFEKTGAAVLLEQRGATAETFAARIFELLEPGRSEAMRNALDKWHAPQAAEQIAESIMRVITARRRESGVAPSAAAANGNHRHQSART